MTAKKKRRRREPIVRDVVITAPEPCCVCTDCSTPDKCEAAQCSVCLGTCPQPDRCCMVHRLDEVPI